MFVVKRMLTNADNIIQNSLIVVCVMFHTMGTMRKVP